MALQRYYYDVDGRVVRILGENAPDSPAQGDEVGMVERDDATVPDPSPPSVKHESILYYDDATDTFSYNYVRRRADFVENLDPALVDEVRTRMNQLNNNPNMTVKGEHLREAMKLLLRVILDDPNE